MKNNEEILTCLLNDYVKERKRGNFLRKFKYIVIILVLFFAFSTYKNLHRVPFDNKPHVALIDIKGAIFEEADADADNFATALNKAYKSKKTKAVILRINSPGGSPVQADYMYDTIMYYKKKYPSIKTYAVCTDMCASAAYYVAAATDEIYSNPSSIVGSIGVIFSSFGFTDLMNKLGIERRLITAGKYKAILDPFSKTNAEQKEKMQTMLNIVHEQFISKVKKGRGDRLQENKDLFTGLFWSGEQARDLGLIDGFGSTSYVARNIVKVNKIVDYTEKQNLFDKFSDRLGVNLAHGMLNLFNKL